MNFIPNIPWLYPVELWITNSVLRFASLNSIKVEMERAIGSDLIDANWSLKILVGAENTRKYF